MSRCKTVTTTVNINGFMKEVNSAKFLQRSAKLAL